MLVSCTNIYFFILNLYASYNIVVLDVFHFQLGQNNLTTSLPMEMGRSYFIRSINTLNVGELDFVIPSSNVNSMKNHCHCDCEYISHFVCYFLCSFFKVGMKIYQEPYQTELRIIFWEVLRVFYKYLT